MQEKVENETQEYITLEEAEKKIPSIAKLIQELQTLQKTLDLLDTVEIEVEDEDHIHSRHITKFNKAYHRLCYEFFQKLDMLENNGCILRDLDEGLIDFICKFQGREVYLCWKDGEKSIQHWHELGTGFSERKKILDLK